MGVAVVAVAGNLAGVLYLEGEEDGVFVERAVPEMLRTAIKDGKLVTTIVEHSA